MEYFKHGCKGYCSCYGWVSVNWHKLHKQYSETCLERPLMRPPVLKDQFLAAGPTVKHNWTCHQRPPVLADDIFVANGMVFQDRFHCTSTCTQLQYHYTGEVVWSSQNVSMIGWQSDLPVGQNLGLWEFPPWWIESGQQWCFAVLCVGNGLLYGNWFSLSQIDQVLQAYHCWKYPTPIIVNL